jgi:hypothetical protein
MPVYILKRYHAVVGATCRVWHLGREIAVSANSDEEAIRTTKGCLMGQLESIGGVLILSDPEGRRIWEQEFQAQRPPKPTPDETRPAGTEAIDGDQTQE